jgi:hypothetical protein
MTGDFIRLVGKAKNLSQKHLQATRSESCVFVFVFFAHGFPGQKQIAKTKQNADVLPVDKSSNKSSKRPAVHVLKLFAAAMWKADN